MTSILNTVQSDALKTCFKCGIEKDFSEYYEHNRMFDGYLSKCKTCTKKDVAERIELKKQDPAWVAKERARCREKSRKYRELGLAPAKSYESVRKWEKRNLHKRSAHLKARRAFLSGKILSTGCCEDCGSSGVKLQMHHEDYSKPLDVNFLCTKCHGKRHWKDRVK